MLERVRKWWANRQDENDARFRRRLDEVKRHNPVPVFWLFGKTQSGKTSLVKFLTGAGDAEIGHGFQPCTRFSREYQFPNADAPLVRFLDTRGVDEPGYDPAVDLASFGQSAHLVVVTVKALDHAQENVLRHLRAIRESQPTRPVLLTLTCLHEAYPQQQHVEPYPFRAFAANEPIDVPNAPPQLTDLIRSLEAQRQRFAGLVDHVVPVDLTRPEEGFAEANYGGQALHDILHRLLPSAQEQTLRVLEEGLTELKELHASRAMPTIIGYSVLAGTAGAIPVPFLSLLLLPGIHRRMLRAIANEYGRALSVEKFMEVAEKLGIGQWRDQARSEVMKLVPSVGVVTSAATAGSAAYALGKAYCYYDQAAQHGELPDPDQLRQYYQEQLDRAKISWPGQREPAPAAANSIGEKP